MTITLYGIPNCDTVKKARSWLDTHGVAYVFHDFKKAGITEAMIASWLQAVDWTTLVNRKGTTWRNLSDERKAAVTDANTARTLMLESPSVIKRPVLCHAGQTQVGFSDALYQQIFNQ